MFLTSCKTFRIHSLNHFFIQSAPQRSLAFGSRLLPPRGPRRQTGTGSGRGRPHHSSGAANFPRGRGGDKSFDCRCHFGAEKCYYYPKFHWRRFVILAYFNPSKHVIYLSVNFVLNRECRLARRYFDCH